MTDLEARRQKYLLSLELCQYPTQDVGAAMNDGTPGTPRQANKGWVQIVIVIVILIGLHLSRNAEPSSEGVRGKPWYYGPISRGDCDNLMTERGQDGDFLVRDSESNVSNIKMIRLFYAWL